MLSNEREFWDYPNNCILHKEVDQVWDVKFL
jgi:hypothetical protein